MENEESEVKFVIIDEDEKFVDELVDMLKEQMKELQICAKLEVERVCDAKEFGMDMIDSNAESCIITEIMLTGIDGLAVARRIREENGHVPIVFCTSVNDYAMECYDLDAAYYLLKPIKPDKVKQMLLRVKKAP